MENSQGIMNNSLTAAEIAYLWTTYIMDSKSKHILEWAVKKAKSEDVRLAMEFSKYLSDKNMRRVKVIFDSINHPIPHGFSDEDVKPGADKLYSDVLMMYILKCYTVFGLSNYGMALTLASRPDVKGFFNESLGSTVELSNMIDDILIKNGYFEKTPHVPIAERVEFASDESFLGNLIGHKRPLSTLEITHVFNASMVSGVGHALLLGLAQVAGDHKAKEFLKKSAGVIKDQIASLNEMLFKENLTIPSTFTTDVMNTKEAPFSDKLSMFFAVTMLGDIINSYSFGKISSMRKDIYVNLALLSERITLLSGEGIKVMIDNGWMEEIPKNSDRIDIIRSKR